MLVLHARGSELERAFPFGVVRQLFERAAGDERWFTGAAGLSRPIFDPAEQAEESSYARLHGLYWLCANLAAEQPLVVCVDEHLGATGKAVVGCAPAATLRGAEERGLEAGARAARASTSDSRRLFERSERSERSEFRRAALGRAPQGSRPARPTAVHERRRTPGRGFASLETPQQ